MEALQKLTELSSYAYDIDVLKEASFAQAMTSAYFGFYKDAIKYYKHAVTLLKIDLFRETWLMKFATSMIRKLPISICQNATYYSKIILTP